MSKQNVRLLTGLVLLTMVWTGTAPALQASASAPVSLVLKNRVVVSDDIVRMKDIAQMDASARSRIGKLAIAVSPELGKTSSILKTEIYEKLVGNGIQTPHIKGPASITVIRKGQVVNPSFFKDKILRYIVTHSKWKDGVEVEISTSKAVVVPESNVRWQLTPANGQDFFGSVLFKARAISAATNDELYSGWIVAKLRIMKRVAISNRTIQKNERLTLNDIRWETREITPFIKEALLTENEILGERPGRIIRANSVITANLLEKKYLVRRGGMATLIAQYKGIKATSSVKVLGNGAIGDTVKVMNTSSKKIMAAVVAGKNKVEVIVE